MRERVYGRREMIGNDGQTYRVVEFEELKPITTKTGTEFIPGMRRLELESGEDVIMLNNKLTVRSTGVVLSEID
jgi:hypothetical protein